MNVSVVVPTLSAAATLPRLLQAIASQSRRPDEVLIVDSSSADNTAQIARAAGCRVVVIPRSEFNHGRTRNQAAQWARGRFIAFMTQDAIPADENFLASLVAPLEDGCAAAYARQIAAEKATPLEKFHRAFNYPQRPYRRRQSDLPGLGIKTFFFSNAASVVERKAFEAVGGFPNDVILNEDMLLCAKLLRAGHTVAYAAEARVLHSHHYSIPSQFRRYFDIGVSIAQSNGLLNGVRASGDGTRFLAAQLKYLADNRHWSWVPYCLAEATGKLLAFQLGKRERLLPRRLKARMSLQAYYWARHAPRGG